MAVTWRQRYLRYRKFFLDIYRVYYQKPEVKAFLEIILTLLVLAFFGAFALRPTILTIIDLLQQIESKEETITTLDQKIQSLSQAQVVFAQEAQNISLLDTAVPDTPLPEDLTRQIEGLAQQNSVAVLGLSIGEVTLIGEDEREVRKSTELAPLPQSAKELNFTISLTGNYQSLTSFLGSIQNLRRPIKIDSLSLNSSETETGSVLVLVISARAPFLKDEN